MIAIEFKQIFWLGSQVFRPDEMTLDVRNFFRASGNVVGNVRGMSPL